MIITVEMHTYTTVMMMLPAAAWQDILGKSVKPSLNVITNEHLVNYNEKTIFSSLSININVNIYTTVMTPLPAATWQDVLGKSVKSILNATRNKHLVIVMRTQPLLNIIKQSNSSDHSFSTNLCFADCRRGSSNMPKWTKKIEKETIIKKWLYVKQMVSIPSRFHQTSKIALNNLHKKTTTKR